MWPGNLFRSILAHAGRVYLIVLAAHLVGLLLWFWDYYIPVAIQWLAIGIIVLPVICVFASRSWRRVIPLCFVILGTPTLLLVGGMATVELGRVRLPDGRVFLLGSEFELTDHVYSLWQASDPIGLVFAKVESGFLTYSEDGSWTQNPEIAATPGGERLLVRRGGIWTDCIETRDELRTCLGTSSSLDWQDPEAGRDSPKQSSDSPAFPPARPTNDSHRGR